MSDTRPPDRPVNAPPAGDGQAIAPRSEAFQRFMAVPLVFALILMTATGVLAALSWFGGEATGPRATIVLQGACAAEARPLVEARAAAMGVAEAQWSLVGDRLTLTATLPGLDNDLEAVPRMLSRPGRLALRGPGGPVIGPDQVAGAQIRLDESGVAYAWVDLTKDGVTALEAALAADPHGELAVTVDDQALLSRPNTRGVKDDGIRVLSSGKLPRDRMQAAADLSILLSHGPLPCALAVESAAPVAAEGDAG